MHAISLATAYFKITGVNKLGRLKCIVHNGDCVLALGLIHCTSDILIGQTQAMLCRKRQGTLEASWLMTAFWTPVPSTVTVLLICMFSTSNALTSLGHSVHKISKAFRNTFATSHFSHYKSAKYECYFLRNDTTSESQHLHMGVVLTSSH